MQHFFNAYNLKRYFCDKGNKFTEIRFKMNLQGLVEGVEHGCRSLQPASNLDGPIICIPRVLTNQQQISFLN